MTHSLRTRPAVAAVIMLRLALAAIMLWAFVDKTFGLGIGTPRARAWLAGGSPTTGYLRGAGGWLGDSFQALAGQPVVDWLFMLGLLCIGIALLLGIGLRIAAVTGTVFFGLLWLSALPLKNNPAIDDHLIYAICLWVIALQPMHRRWSVRLPVWLR